MKRRRLGRSGLVVSEVCLGTMTFGNMADERESLAILDEAFAKGVDFLDVAEIYPVPPNPEHAGRSEQIVGKWLAQRPRDSVVVATKVAGPGGGWFVPPVRGGRTALDGHHIERAVEASLRRLQTEVIDLYQTHHFDEHTPIEETLRALDDLVRAGKVRYVGCSNYPAWRLSEALATSERLGLARYETVQPRYNLLYREIETELLPLARSQGLGVLVYNPIAGGVLSGKYAQGDQPQQGTRFTLGRAGALYQRRYWDDAMLGLAQELQDAAKSRDLPLPTVAVAWVLQQSGITSAIIGASRPDQLAATVAGATVKLDPELSALCDAAFFRLPRQPVLEGYR